MKPSSKTISGRDIAETLKKCGLPKANRLEKKQAVIKLFADNNVPRTNFQGIDILDDLSAYPEY